MAIFYTVLVQHINADDNNFLADKLRAIRADRSKRRSLKENYWQTTCQSEPLIISSESWIHKRNRSVHNGLRWEDEHVHLLCSPPLLPMVKFQRKAPTIRLLAGNGFC